MVTLEEIKIDQQSKIKEINNFKKTQKKGTLNFKSQKQKRIFIFQKFSLKLIKRIREYYGVLRGYKLCRN